MLVDRGIMLSGFKSSDIVDNDCTEVEMALVTESPRVVRVFTTETYCI
jgi:hypothetical protein